MSFLRGIFVDAFELNKVLVIIKFAGGEYGSASEEHMRKIEMWFLCFFLVFVSDKNTYHIYNEYEQPIPLLRN